MSIKVMVVDDSALVRKVITTAIEKEPDIDVLATAQDPILALHKMSKEWPDVIVLDIEMPRMDGLTFLRKIMAERPTPVVICSSLAEEGSQVALDALSAGAISIITKPKLGVKAFLEDASNDIVRNIRSAARANMGALQQLQQPKERPFFKATPKQSINAVLPRQTSESLPSDCSKLIAIGASTGGTQALEAILTRLPLSTNGIVIVQHMPKKFTAAFAQRLNNICQIEIKEAQNGDRIRSGLALIAPGGQHMLVKRSGTHYYVEVQDGPLVNHHKPSVDVLFRSVAQEAGKNAMGIIMTGMGDDGALGLKEMHDTGARTIAEDESTCVVFGMPKEAIKLGGAVCILPLNKISEEIASYQ